MPVTGGFRLSRPAPWPARVRDAVLVNDAGFAHLDGSGWQRAIHAQDRAGRQAVHQHSVVGGGVYQDISPVRAGESFCADAEVVTAASRSGARGAIPRLLACPGVKSRRCFRPLPARTSDYVSTVSRRPNAFGPAHPFSDALQRPDSASTPSTFTSRWLSTVVSTNLEVVAGNPPASRVRIELAPAGHQAVRRQGLRFHGTRAPAGHLSRHLPRDQAGDSLVPTPRSHGGGSSGRAGHMSSAARRVQNDSSSVNFGPLWCRNQWTHVSTA